MGVFLPATALHLAVGYFNRYRFVGTLHTVFGGVRLVDDNTRRVLNGGAVCGKTHLLRVLPACGGVGGYAHPSSVQVWRFVNSKPLLAGILEDADNNFPHACYKRCGHIVRKQRLRANRGNYGSQFNTVLLPQMYQYGRVFRGEQPPVLPQAHVHRGHRPLQPPSEKAAG